MVAKNNSARLALEALDARDVPSVVSPVHAKRYAVASGAGEPSQVSVYASGSNALLTTFMPFGKTYTGGVTVATGDVTGDGVDDVVVAAKTGSSAVKVFDGKTHKQVAAFEAFAGSKAGAFVALGDVTGDGRLDLIAGGTSTVRVFRGQELWRVAAELQSFGAAFTGGVRVAAGDVNGDGIADIITAPGAGYPAVVKVHTVAAKWGDTAGATFQSKVSTIGVGGPTDRGGVFVSAGDLDGDGRADIAVGRTVGSRATVTVFKGNQPNKVLLQAFGFQNTQPGGVPVALHDLDGDGRAEVIAGGGNGVSQVRVIGGRGGLQRSFMAFTPNYRGGVYVG
jgi:serralysin